MVDPTPVFHSPPPLDPANYVPASGLAAPEDVLYGPPAVNPQPAAVLDIPVAAPYPTGNPPPPEELKEPLARLPWEEVA
jgi:hypothetical protein